MSRYIAPSLLAADFGCLRHDIDLVNGSDADFFHLDIMDGVFVPNISFGIPVIEAVKKLAKKPLDVHLMIVHPERYLKKFRDAGADILTVHIETCMHLHRTLQEIKELGMKAGVSLNPHTPVELLKDILGDIDWDEYSFNGLENISLSEKQEMDYRHITVDWKKEKAIKRLKNGTRCKLLKAYLG